MNRESPLLGIAAPIGARLASLDTVLIGLAGTLALLGALLWILAAGHLDEDAYILFTYSTHLAQGHGIVWDLAHGPAEGATDFLWMVALAGLEYTGLDVGAAAALLNSLGFALSYAAISRIAQLEGRAAHLLLCLLYTSPSPRD